MPDAPLRGWTAVVAAWVQGVARHPWLSLAGLALLGALAVLYIPGHLRMDTSTSDLFSRALPWRQAEARLDRAFPQLNDNLVIVIRGATPALADQAAVRLGQALRADPKRFPYVYLGQDEPFLRRNGLLFRSRADLDRLSQRLSQVQPLLGQWARQPNLPGLLAVLDRVMRHAHSPAGSPPGENAVGAGAMTPLLDGMTRVFGAAASGRTRYLPWQSLLQASPQGAAARMHVLAVRPKLDFNALLPGKKALQAIQRLSARLGLDARHGVRIGLTGPVAFQHHERVSLMHDLPLFAGLSVVAVAVLLVLALRSLRMVLATVVTLLLGLVLSAGFAAAAVGRLNLLSVAFVLLYVGLGIDYGIHFCLSYREARGAGEGHLGALRWTARHTGVSVTSCAVTTALALYVFVLTPFTALAELGLIAGTSMLISLAVTLTALPALLSLLGSGAGRARAAHAGLPGAWRTWPHRHRRAVLVSAAVVAAGALAALPRVHFQTNPIRMRDPHSEAVRTFETLVRDSPRSPLAAAVLTHGAAAARAVKRRVEALPEVNGTMDLADWIPQGQGPKLNTIAQMRLILGPIVPPGFGLEPADARARQDALRRFLPVLRAYAAASSGPTGVAAHRLLTQVQRFWSRSRSGADAAMTQALAHGLLAGLPDTLERLQQSLRAQRVTARDLPQVIRRRWLSPGGLYRVAVYPRANLMNDRALRRFVAGLTRVAPEASGTPVVMVRAAGVVIRAFLEALAYTAALTLAVLWLTFRNFGDSLRALVPLALAGLLTCAAMGLAGMSFNFANIIALPLLLGAGVDYGIHMVSRARHAVARDTSVLATSTPVAVVYSALTTLASFGNLAFTGHGGPASMGRVLALGLALVLLTDLLVLPALLPAPRPAGGPA